MDTRDTDKLDYAAEFLEKLRLELRTIGTALGAAQSSLTVATPYQRRTILIGLCEVFNDTSLIFADGKSMLENFLFVNMERKPSP